MGALRRAAALGWLCCALLGAQAAPAAAEREMSAEEAQLKAAYVFKIGEYIGWPPAAFPDANASLAIGVLGAPALVAELERLKGEHKIGGRAVEVRNLKPGDSLAGLHILVLGERDGARLRRALDAVLVRPVLTITDVDGGLEAGSVINFVPVEQRIRFDASVLHAERSGLKISARLLAVARKIDSGR